MKKTKKIKKLLSSFVCLIGSAIGITTGLSSCVLNPNDDKNEDDTDDSVITPPNDDNSNDNNNNENNGGNGNEGNNGSDNEKPSEPGTKPEVKPPVDNKPTDPNPPENKPESTPPSSNLIGDNSISLKEHGKLLPSQYLLDINDLNNLNIDTKKIEENFDKNKVLQRKYVVLYFNDQHGNLSIKMTYTSSINNNLYEFIFNFSNLSKLESEYYSLSFDVYNKNLLNAKDITNKQVNNNEESKIFFKYLGQNGANLIFKNNSNQLSLDYLNFEKGLIFSGFNDNWYKTNDDLILYAQPKLLKVNVYEKKIDSNSITIEQKWYPTNLIGSNGRPISLSCPSALDYLLDKIIANDDFKEDKFASYYYYDILNNNGFVSQLQLTDGKWLKNVVNKIDDYNKKYRPIFSKTIDPDIDKDGNLIIQIQMEIGDENIVSKTYKQLVIKSFLKLSNNLFYYGSNSRLNKFSLFCDAQAQDEIFDYIKKHANILRIKDDINSSNNSIVDLSKYFNLRDHIYFKKFIKLYFDNSEIVKDDNSEYYTSADKRISINGYEISYYNSSNVIIQYDKEKKCFQTKCSITLECKGIDYEASESDEMTVNITKINKSLEE